MEKLEFINDNGKLTIQKSNISGSKFHRVILDDCNFNDVSMKNCKIIDANLINLEIEDAQLGGVYFHNISGSPANQSSSDPALKTPSLRFENCDLKSAKFSDCNLKILRYPTVI